MTKVFVDTDVCIDLLSGGKPFNAACGTFISLADTNKIKIYVSSISFANIDYVLSSQYSTKNSRQILGKFKTLVNEIGVVNKTIDLAISSDFNDFEDAIQYHCALENNMTILITGNIRDYKRRSSKY